MKMELTANQIRVLNDLAEADFGKEELKTMCDGVLTNEYLALYSTAEKWADEHSELIRDGGTNKERIDYVKMEFEKTYAKLQECSCIIKLLCEKCK